MEWNPDEITGLAAAYRKHYDLAHGDRPSRLRAADEFFWAVEELSSASYEGTVPIELLDVILHQDPADSGYQAYVAAGPIEDALKADPDRYGPLMLSRSRTDELWADALRCVWISHKEWEALPEELRELVPEPGRAQADAAKKAARRPKRPSKRQDRRGRR